MVVCCVHECSSWSRICMHIHTHTHTCTNPPECLSLSSAGIYTHAMDFIAPNHVMPRQMYAQAKVDCNTNCKSCIAHAERHTPTATSAHHLTHQHHRHNSRQQSSAAFQQTSERICDICFYCRFTLLMMILWISGLGFVVIVNGFRVKGFDLKFTNCASFAELCRCGGTCTAASWDATLTDCG